MQWQVFLPVSVAPEPHEARRHPDSDALTQQRPCAAGVLRAHAAGAHLATLPRGRGAHLQEGVRRHGGARVRLQMIARLGDPRRGLKQQTGLIDLEYRTVPLTLLRSYDEILNFSRGMFSI